MNEQPRRPLGPLGPQPWDVVRNKLDQSLPFANMRDTPYYRDCVWEQFSAGEYKRRYESLRAKMREHKLDAVVVPGGPSHWSFGAGMTWLTGHWEWHALAAAWSTLLNLPLGSVYSFSVLLRPLEQDLGISRRPCRLSSAWRRLA